MTQALLVEVVPSCSPERFVRLGAGLLERVAQDPRPRLLLAELKGETLLLGRHQRAASALEKSVWDEAPLPLARRLGGGRALVAGDGRVGLVLALPRLGSLLQGSIPADKVLNRYVRGLLVGLSRLGAGAGAHYFGRDFVSSESRQIARISHDGLSTGPIVFEAIVGIQKGLEVPAALRGYPVHSDPKAEGPPSVTLSELWHEPHSFEGIVQAIVSGYEKAFDIRSEILGSSDAEEAPISPPVWEEEEGFEDSGVADIPIGFAEALVRHSGGKIEAVRFRGDFLAPAFAVRALEEELVGVPLDFQEIGTRVDAAFRREGASILGLRGLRIFPDAILAAAGRL